MANGSLPLAGVEHTFGVGALSTCRQGTPGRKDPAKATRDHPAPHLPWEGHHDGKAHRTDGQADQEVIRCECGTRSSGTPVPCIRWHLTVIRAASSAEVAMERWYAGIQLIPIAVSVSCGPTRRFSACAMMPAPICCSSAGKAATCMCSTHRGAGDCSCCCSIARGSSGWLDSPIV